MTADVTTSKRINLGQLTAELGGVELSAVTRRGKTTISGDVDQATLGAAVAAHTASDAADNESRLQQHAIDALASNRAFLALPSPTSRDLADQVKSLTRQNNGLIRLALGQFDATD